MVICCGKIAVRCQIRRRETMVGGHGKPKLLKLAAWLKSDCSGPKNGSVDGIPHCENVRVPRVDCVG
jgi:hypothetical protein